MGYMNCAICCGVISVWGIVQLIVMGILYGNKYLLFLEDAEEHDNKLDASQFVKKTTQNYNDIAINCYIAGACYFISLAGAFGCYFVAKKKEKRRQMVLESELLTCDSAARKSKLAEPKEPKKPKKEKAPKVKSK